MKRKTTAKPQFIMIGGGMTFNNNKDYIKYLKSREVSLERKVRWHNEYLINEIGKCFDIFKIEQPSADNAVYENWKINFEKYIPLLKPGLSLLGSSLGAIFLVKYLSENKFPKKIKSLYLVCAPFDDTLPGENLSGGFKLKRDLSLLIKNCSDVNFFFSKDDDVVPIEHAEKYAKKLPQAKFCILESANGHFKMEEFPELVKTIKSKIKKC